MGKDLNGKDLGTGISQRKKGKYQARYVDRFGKRVTVYADSAREAKKKLSEVQERNIREENLPNEKILLSEWYDKWRMNYKKDSVRQSTLLYYDYVWTKHLKDKLGKYKVSQINQIMVKRALKEIQNNGLKFETINKSKIILLDMFDKAIVNNFANKNPVRGIKIERDEKTQPRVLSVEDQQLFFECSKGTFYDNFFVVAVCTGLRCGELAALIKEDIDFENKTIRVNKTLLYQKLDGDSKKEFHLGDTKTNTSNRTVPITRQCEVALKKQFILYDIIRSKTPKKLDANFENLLFTTKYGTPINPQIVVDSVKKIVDEINLSRDVLEYIEPFSCHAFRHTFATRCFEAGIKPKTVQVYLGHATLDMTMNLYTHVLPEHQENEMGLLEDNLDALLDKDGANIDEEFNAHNKLKIVKIG